MSHYEMRTGKIGFTLVELLIGAVLFVLVFGGVYYLFSSTISQSRSGTGKIVVFQRMQLLTEVFRDDIREAFSIDATEPENQWSNKISYKKFVSLQEGTHQPRIRQVLYEFTPADKKLVGKYGEDGVLIHTNLFESVQFQKIYLASRPYVRMKIIVKPEPESEPVIFYFTAGSRYINSLIADKFWYSLPDTGVLND